MDKTSTQTMTCNGISEETRVIITLALYGKLKSNRAAGEACWKPMGSLCCWGHALRPNCSSLPSASVLQQKANRRLTYIHSCLKKYTTSYLGPLSARSVKYSLIKYSLAKNAAEIMIQTRLLLSTCLWVFVVFGQFLPLFSGVLNFFRVHMNI